MSDECYVCKKPVFPNAPLSGGAAWCMRNITPGAASGSTMRPVHHHCMPLTSSDKRIAELEARVEKIRAELVKAAGEAAGWETLAKARLSGLQHERARAEAAERRLAMLKEPDEEMMRICVAACLQAAWGHDVAEPDYGEWHKVIRAALVALSAHLGKD